MGRNLAAIFLAILAAVLIVAVVVYHRPADKRSLYDQAIAAMTMGDMAGARVYLERALKIDPGYAQAHYALAVAYLRSDPAQLDKALEHKNKAQQLGYTIPEWFDNYYKILSKKADQ